MKSNFFKLLACSFIVTALFLFVPVSSSFAAGYADGTCTIDKVGAAANYNFVFVTNPTAGYDNQWFKLDNTNRKELLATLLTAYSMNAEVEIYIEDDGATISRIRMVN
ncbi:MAG: hypothetical protein U5L07_14735 [Desulfobacterales bacterium]|nr:hypothetical protein [Desulfobacterales bacterium]